MILFSETSCFSLASHSLPLLTVSFSPPQGRRCCVVWADQPASAIVVETPMYRSATPPNTAGSAHRFCYRAPFLYATFGETPRERSVNTPRGCVLNTSPLHSAPGARTSAPAHSSFRNYPCYRPQPRSDFRMTTPSLNPAEGCQAFPVAGGVRG